MTQPPDRAHVVIRQHGQKTARAHQGRHGLDTIHYTFVDGHQGDYYCRVVEDCVGGSSVEAHNAALRAMEYLQGGAVRRSDEILAAFAASKAT